MKQITALLFLMGLTLPVLAVKGYQEGDTLHEFQRWGGC